MRKLLVVAAACVMSMGAAAAVSVAGTESNVGSIRSDLVNEGAIRELYTGFTAAWNRHDAEAMGAMWALDGDHLEPDGHLAKGREAVTKLFATQHSSVFKDTQLTLSVEDVWFITGDVALIDGSYEVAGAKLPDGTKLDPRKGHITSVLLKESDKWWIVASRLMIPTHLPYKKD
jgi:uncharacterized protein (TIGR02246 family)